MKAITNINLIVQYCSLMFESMEVECFVNSKKSFESHHTVLIIMVHLIVKCLTRLFNDKLL